MMRVLLCSLIGHRRAAAREYKLVAARTTIVWERCPRCGHQHRVDTPTALVVRCVAASNLIPTGYGVAWVRWQTGDAVCMPIPLNIVAAAALRAWHWCRHPGVLVKDPYQAFLQGYHAGLRAGQQHGDGGSA